MQDALASAVEVVVSGGNCSGCGVCALISPRITVALDERAGFLRPRVAEAGSGDSAAAEGDRFARLFAAACPGSVVRDAPSAIHRDCDLGAYVSVWAGWATDSDVRFRASSGGVLTALSQWLIGAGVVTAVAAAGQHPTRPTCSAPVRVSDPEAATQACGSRYAPVSSVSALAVGSDEALVAKPCEIAGLRAVERDRRVPPTLAMAMFCAGTPSQKATDELVGRCGWASAEVAAVRYRGLGWPGRFVVTDKDGATASIPYQAAWGEVLGRRIEERCRICPDGTGVWADISVGDLWESDERGYPKFSEAAGRCAVIARTERGHALLLRAAEAGVVHLEPIGIDEVVRAQPVQVARTRSLLARLLARRLMGRATPDYRGFPLVSSALRHPVVSLKYFLGTILRSRRSG